MNGSVPPGLATLPGAWSSFFIAIAEVSATLAGLSFVAVSAHPSILREPGTRYKAQRTLVTFVVVLVGALILAMPQPPADSTTNVLLWSSVAGAAITITSIVRESQSRKPLDWLRVAITLNAFELVVAYSIAGVWALLHLSPDDPPLSPYVLGSYMVAVVGWSALQTWRLMQIALRARLHADRHSTPEQPDGVLPAAQEQLHRVPPAAQAQLPRVPSAAQEQHAMTSTATYHDEKN